MLYDSVRNELNLSNDTARNSHQEFQAMNDDTFVQITQGSRKHKYEDHVDFEHDDYFLNASKLQRSNSVGSYFNQAREPVCEGVQDSQIHFSELEIVDTVSEPARETDSVFNFVSIDVSCVNKTIVPTESADNKSTCNLVTEHDVFCGNVACDDLISDPRLFQSQSAPALFHTCDSDEIESISMFSDAVAKSPCKVNAQNPLEYKLCECTSSEVMRPAEKISLQVASNDEWNNDEFDACTTGESSTSGSSRRSNAPSRTAPSAPVPREGSPRHHGENASEVGYRSCDDTTISTVSRSVSYTRSRSMRRTQSMTQFRRYSGHSSAYSSYESCRRSEYHSSGHSRHHRQSRSPERKVSSHDYRAESPTTGTCARRASSSPSSSSSRSESNRRRYRSAHYCDLPLEWWERTDHCKEAKARHTDRIDHMCGSRESLVLKTTLWREDTVLEPNMFPYYTPYGVEHYTLWCIEDMSHQQIVSFVDAWLYRHMPHVCRWQYDDNSGERSIDLFHVHVFIETRPYSFAPREGMLYVPPHSQPPVIDLLYDARRGEELDHGEGYSRDTAIVL